MRCAEVGIPQIFVLDPKQPTKQVWNSRSKSFDLIQDLQLNNGVTILGQTIWREFDKRIQERSQAQLRRLIVSTVPG